MNNKLKGAVVILFLVLFSACSKKNIVPLEDLPGEYFVERISVATPNITKPAKTAKLILKNDKSFRVSSWPLTSLPIIVDDNSHLEGLFEGGGKWTASTDVGGQIITLLFEARPPLVREFASVLKIRDRGRLRVNINAGSEDDFMILVRK